jgi:hypothetical protein
MLADRLMSVRLAAPLPLSDRIEALGEPAGDRREEIARFSVTALVAAEPVDARGGAHFREPEGNGCRRIYR